MFANNSLRNFVLSYRSIIFCLIEVYFYFSAELSTLLEQLDELRSSQGVETGPDRLVRESAQGHVETVRDILSKHPDKVWKKLLDYYLYMVGDVTNPRQHGV